MKVAITSDTHLGCSSSNYATHTHFLSQIAAENPDLLIHAGDWTSHAQHQFRQSLEMFREYLKCPIVAVRGNHDFWQTPNNQPFYRTETVLETHNKWFEEFNIHHVSKGPFEIQDWTVYGFDGWYASTNPPTHDKDYLPLMTNEYVTMEWFTRKAHTDLVNMLDLKGKDKNKKICVSHFPPFTEDQRYAILCANLNYLDVLADNFEFLIFGHSHRACDWRFRDTRIVNPGSDYNRPIYKIIEI